MRRLALRAAFWFLAVSWLVAVSAAVPEAANGYKRLLSAEAESAWGLNAPIARFAAQIHQESLWRPTARSKYAAGLGQFTPGTAADMGKWYPMELQPVDPDNPQWSIRALVMYDLRLLNSIFPIPKSASIPECDHWAMVMAAYNGGIGWINRDRALANTVGVDQNLWWGSVEYFTRRADWAREENRTYPVRILTRWEPMYLAAGWPGAAACL